jgi:hypothetical protein
MQEFLNQIIGPFGALVIAVILLSILGRNHLANDRTTIADKDETIRWGRARITESETRLDAFRETMRANTDVLERSVALNEKLVAISGRAQDTYEREQLIRGRER